MSLRQKYLEILSAIVPAGVVGVSLLLGTTAPGAASEEPAAAEPLASHQMRVAERLAAIRDAVSDVAANAAAKAGDAAEPDSKDLRLAWGNWWRNGGWGYRPWGGWGWPNWNNWHNWHNWNNWWRNW
ncbi:MAG TPA: hypothetical protein VMF05_04475 [Stellaceae bacterium]|nr:hypothetical protein [Stellaceae bacterium]